MTRAVGLIPMCTDATVVSTQHRSDGESQQLMDPMLQAVGAAAAFWSQEALPHHSIEGDGHMDLWNQRVSCDVSRIKGGGDTYHLLSDHEMLTVADGSAGGHAWWSTHKTDR